ncbi:MAG TPA: hypothetical protein VMS60_15765 [Solirubrobacterales bacterium]|nr:hypothetical protein [Solirubrobacterales bacterium]
MTTAAAEIASLAIGVSPAGAAEITAPPARDAVTDDELAFLRAVERIAEKGLPPRIAGDLPRYSCKGNRVGVRDSLNNRFLIRTNRRHLNAFAIEGPWEFRLTVKGREVLAAAKEAGR